MHVSVVICTWNRCESLGDALEALCGLHIPDGVQWELVVVDNGSTDATERVIAGYRQRLPLRRLFVPDVGLSRARNAALRVVAGELVLFADDDVRVDPDWLKAHEEAARRWPGAGYFAGAIRPRFDRGVPRWVRRNRGALAGMLCARDLGDRERRLRPSEFPFGPNMAVRRAALGDATFDDRVGRAGHQQVRGGEDSLFWALRAKGVWGAWVPSARVEHHVPRSRADVGYLWSYYFGCGQAQIRLAVTCGSYSRLHILTAPLREIAKSGLWCWVWARHLATAACLSGQVSELWRSGLWPAADRAPAVRVREDS